MARSLNKLMLIGNLTRDPEVRYTPSGTAVCNFSVATNREWVDSNNQKKDEVTYTRIVAWHKLAEICSQYLRKGSKVYVEGRISNRVWEDKQGIKHYDTEMVLDEMVMLDSKKIASTQSNSTQPSMVEPAPPEPEPTPPEPNGNTKGTEDVSPDDIPF